MTDIEIFLYKENSRDIALLQACPAEFLSDVEQQRLVSMGNQKRRNTFMCGRYLLKATLARKIGCPVSELELRLSSTGKPELAQPLAASEHWHFSLAHSGGWLVVATSYGAAVGVDIEQSEKVRSLALARRIMSHREFDIFMPLASEQQRAYFYHCWVLKEAFVKMHGGSVWRDVSQLETDVDASFVESPGARCWAAPLVLPEPLTGAVVLGRSPGSAVRLLQHDVSRLTLKGELNIGLD